MLNKTSPPGVGKGDWNRWIFELGCYSPFQKNISVEMIDHLKMMEQLPNQNQWLRASYECLELLWHFLEKAHKLQLPEMSCQRSGRCCHKQVPRVSRFEIKPIVMSILALPPTLAGQLVGQCLMSTKEVYKDPVLGMGVRCPLLVQNDQTKEYACSVHSSRPYICRLAGISSALSWDCPIWQIHKESFPTLDPEVIRPFLELFSYCRNHYSLRFLQDPAYRQMVLLGAGVAAEMGINPPARPDQPEVIQAIAHRHGYADELYFQKPPAPPPEVPRTEEGYVEALGSL